MKRISIFLFFFSIMTGFVLLAQDTVTYNDNIKPIVTQNCVSCHPFMSSYSSMMSEVSSRSPVTTGLKIVNPSKPDSSVIIWRLEGRTVSGTALIRMPYFLAPLPDATIAVFRTWISQGAQEKIITDVKSSTWFEIKKKFR